MQAKGVFCMRLIMAERVVSIHSPEPYIGLFQNFEPLLKLIETPTKCPTFSSKCF